MQSVDVTLRSRRRAFPAEDDPEQRACERRVGLAEEPPACTRATEAPAGVLPASEQGSAHRPGLFAQVVVSFLRHRAGQSVA